MYFSYFGGKKKAADWIFSQIPESIKKETKTFTEVFSGAFWVYAQNDWSFIDVKIKTDNHHPVTKRKTESTILIKYVYDDKTYNIVQQYSGDDSIMENFPLYTVNEIKNRI